MSPRNYLAAAIILSIGMSQEVSASTLLEEITVVAQKREESAQDVPISISAFSNDALKSAGVTSTDSLTQVIPGLLAHRNIGSSTPFLRGIGTQANSAGNEGAVATYVDGVFVSSLIAAAQSFNNIDRIEVLKGPQGTLFGRNTTGGVIHIITRNPEFEASGTVSASYGDYETAGLNFYGTTGVSDSVAADLAIYYEDQGEGYGTNLTTGNDVSLTETLSVRSKWLWEASEQTTVTATLSYSEKESSFGIARRLVDGALGLDGALIFGGCMAGGGTPAACTAAAQAGASKFTGSFNDSIDSIDPLVDAEDMGFDLRVEHALENLDFVSLTSYRETEEDQVLDTAVVAFPGGGLLVDLLSRADTFVQEFQLISSNDSGFQWQVGLFYLNDESLYDSSGIYGRLFNILQGVDRVVLEPVQKTESIAVYGQGTYSISDRLRFTLGLRYSEDERELTGQQGAILGGMPLLAPLGDKEGFDEPTWRLALDYDIGEDALLYASYNRGFKSGVYNTLSPGTAVEPEIVDAYEVGFKSTLLGGTMRLNGSVFFYDYQDLQLQAVTGTGVVMLVNAADAEIFGAELEWLWAATDSLDLYANVSHLDTEYTDFPGAQLYEPTGIGGNSHVIFNAAGNELSRAPEYTFNIGGAYTWQLDDNGAIKLNANYYYNDGFFWEQGNSIEQESYELLAAGLSWVSPREKYEVRISGNNLLDEEYAINRTIGATSDGMSPAAPRTYGIEFRYNFGRSD